MRLLERNDSGGFNPPETIPPGGQIPQYAILSHTWGPEEVDLKDLAKGVAQSKSGYRKIQFCGEQAERDGLQHFWVDTCCIDKSSSAELQESINSMFRWYRDAVKCYVYLADVSSITYDSDGELNEPAWESDFRQSRWFKRGWTLQELIAPRVVEFFSKEGIRLGTKESLEKYICDITGIPARALRGDTALSGFSVAERMAWKQGRETTREEDMAYCLLGMFDVQMPLLYSEGKEKAMARLRDTIQQSFKGTQHEDYDVPFSLSGVAEAELFVAREKELENIHDALRSDGSRHVVVLHGLGGIGKTQLAVEYTKRHKDDYSAIFWINIKDGDSLRQSFFKIAKQILRCHPLASRLGGLDGNQDVEEVIDAVKAWLSLPRNSRWLIVYDNYDDPKLPGSQSPTAVDIQDYVPESYQGSILVTTRSSQVQIGHTIRLEKLRDEKDSLKIISSIAKKKNLANEPGSAKLLKELDGLPLALAAAGAYLGRATITPSEYLSLYKESWTNLLRTTPHLNAYDRRLYSTWQVSLDQIEAQNELAGRLLRFWAYLDNEDLWFELLRYPGGDDTEWLNELTKDKLSFQDTIGYLHDYGIVEWNTTTDEQVESRGYSIHNCVHSWTMNILNPKWDWNLARLAIECVASHIPGTESAQWWVTQRRLLQHVAKCTQHISNMKLEEQDVAWTLYKFGDMFKDQCKHDEAEAMYQRALHGYEKALGPDHTSTLDTVNNLGLIYRAKGKLGDAKALYQRALQGYEKTLGPDHISTLRTVNNLGNLYMDQGNPSEAEALYQRALQGYEKTLGPDHIKTLGIVNNLSLLYKDQGKLSKAETMYQQALLGYKNALGSDHTSTLGIVNNLGLLYVDQGKPSEAEAMYQQALQGYEKALGPDHILTLRIVNNLGLLYKGQGKLSESESLYQRALQGYETALGPDHASTLGTVNNLGLLYKDQGRLGEAEAMYKQALERKEKTLGPEHT